MILKEVYGEGVSRNQKRAGDESTWSAVFLEKFYPGMGEPGGLPSMGSHSRTRLKRLSSSSSSSNKGQVRK